MVRTRHRPAVAALVAAFLMGLATIVPVAADTTVQTLPFSQDWSNTDLISASDDWSGVPGIVGYRGDGLASSTATDPQGVLADGSATPLDVNANQSTPNTFTSGGIAEFHITDPVVALQGSGTADAPHLVLSLDTTGADRVRVAYNLRDVDGSADNSVQPVALHYRVGGVGSYTNVPAAYVADASTGPSLATLVTPVDVMLPADAADQPLLEVRIMTTDAPGSDEWIGVDDIVVSEQIGDPAPFVQSTSPSDGATNVAVTSNISITFSEPATIVGSWFSIVCTTSGAHTAGVSGGPDTYVLNPNADFAESESCTVTIAAAGVRDLDSDDPPDTMVADHEFSFTTVGPLVESTVAISQVYGGGGNSGATYTNDFIELYNRGDEPVSVDGWSVQYASSAGSSWQVTALGGSIPPGKHYLIKQAAGAGGTVELPDPDATGTISMAAGSGKVALVASATPLTGTCPGVADIVDFVGYGSANCFEGSGAAPTLSNTTAALRNDDGASDTDDNAADFTTGAPTPRPSTESAPTVSSSFPSEGATGVASWTTLTITFSEPVAVTGAWFDLQCSTSLSHSATVTGGPTSFTLDPVGTFAGGETCTVTIAAANVSDLDSADPPDTMAADATIAFTVADEIVCGDPATLISAVQGSGTASPIEDQVVEIEGVVVGAFPGTTGFQGLHVQEEDADHDADPATSEGVFVFEPNGGATYAVGDVVRVQGRVFEFSSGGQRLTELTSLNNLVVCSSGASVTPADVTLPFAGPTHAERYESMLVDIAQELTVTETFGLGRFGEVVLSSGGRLLNPTNVVEPGAPAIALQAANDLRRIVLDDGDNRQNLDPTLYPTGGLSATNTLRVGDTTPGGTFVLEQRFGTYRLQPTAVLPTWQSTNPRSTAPTDPGGGLSVASFNVLNYFDTLDLGPDICGPEQDQECRGADSEAELERQRAKIVAALAGLDADVVGLIEIENDAGDAVEDLLDAVNDELGTGTYDFVETGTIGTDAIKVALIFKPAAVTPVGDHAILDASVDPRFDDTRSRPALAQAFETTAGARFTVVVNHLKSKGSECAGDPDTGDGQGNCNVTRTDAAHALVDWLAADPTGSGDRDVLVIGDLNAYAREDPIDVFVDAGYTNLVEAFGGADAYSYVFQGQSGYLDHALASPTLAAQVAGTVAWHVNADEPPVLDYNVEFKSSNHVDTLYAPTPYRSSDHDPVLVGLDLLHFGFDGFLPPVAAEGPTDAKAGAALPMRFSLSGASSLDVLFATPVSRQVDCTTGAPTGDWVLTTATDGLTYDGKYTYDWKTDKGWTATCREFELTLDDGAYRRATIHFRR